jgi:hypothetical protein
MVFEVKALGLEDVFEMVMSSSWNLLIGKIWDLIIQYNNGVQIP